jgi:hypothetical protein
VPALILLGGPEQGGLVAELLSQAFRLLVDLGLFATTLFLFSLPLLLFLF